MDRTARVADPTPRLMLPYHTRPARHRSVRRTLSAVLAALLTILALGMQPSSTAQAAGNTFTVSKTADTSDGTCDADCSLREAIVAANAVAAGPNTINVPP